jgi:hypothetical protein
MSESPPHTESELVEFVRSIEARAPERLHSDVQMLVSRRTKKTAGTGRSSRIGGLGMAATVAAVSAAVLAIVLGTGAGAPTLSLRQASALTLAPATLPAPAESASDGAQLAAAVDGVSFPYWKDRLGWRSTGARSDRVGGRTVTTVFYTDGHGHRVGYAIVASAPPHFGGGVLTQREHTPYRLSLEHGAAVVTWLRDGHMCVLSGRGVDDATLLRLASWDDDRATSVPS